jgi:hypothetical protein
MLGKVFPSPEERSTTENPSEGSPCSYIGGGGPPDETFGEEGGGGEDLVGEGGSGETSLDKDEDPLTSMRERLIPLRSSIVNKWRERGRTLREK